MYQPKDVITTVDQIYENQRQAYDSQTQKFLDHIDDLCRAWIEHSTYLTMATVDAAGNMDVSPKGDPAGFVKVLDPKTLAIPDRPGNHRYDGFRNILETGRIGLVFLVPNRNEVVRVNGSAQVVQDLAVREQCAIKGRVPDFRGDRARGRGVLPLRQVDHPLASLASRCATARRRVAHLCRSSDRAW